MCNENNDSSEFLRMLENHRSIRKFEKKKIPDEHIKRIVAAAQSASSSSHGQAYSIVNVTDREKREKLVDYTGDQKHLLDCSHFFVFCADLHRIDKIAGLSETDMSESLNSIEMFIVATVDAALAAQNAAVAAEALGYGIVYTGGIRNNPQKVTDLLKLPERTYPVFGMCIGYPNPRNIPDKKPRLPASAVFFENEYLDFEEMNKHIQMYDQIMKEYYANRKQNPGNRNWSETMTDKRKVPRRLFMKAFLNNQKFPLE